MAPLRHGRSHVPIAAIAVPLFLILAMCVPGVSGRAAQVTPLPASATVDTRLGLDDVLAGAPPGSAVTWASDAVSAGATGDRWELRWDRIEPKPGQWSYGADDPPVGEAVRAGMDVLGILIGTPAWATAPGQKAGNGVPRGLQYPVDDPRNLWASYVRATVQHFSGEINEWEIWNEPDLPFFWGGTAADYAALLSESYRVIKQIQPSSTVVMAGLVVPGQHFLSDVLADLGNSRPIPFDAVSWHAYGPAHKMFDNIESMRSVLAGDGLGAVPIWATEDGFPASNPNGEPRQAAYVMQSIAYGLLAHAARIYVYRASDDATGKAWGLMTSSGQPRMAYVAFQVVSRTLAGIQDFVEAGSSATERIAGYAPGRVVVIAWSRASGPAALHLPLSDSLSAADWQGAVVTPTFRGNQALLPLSGAVYNAGTVDPTNSVVGGPPVVAIESSTGDSSLAVQSVLTVAPSNDPAVTVLNPGQTSAHVDLQSLSAPARVLPIDIAPGTTARVDTRLLGGPGQFAVRSALPVPSLSGGAPARLPSTTWYVPGAGQSLSAINPNPTAQMVTLASFSAGGRASPTRAYHLAPFSAVRLPVVNGYRGAALVSASAPVVVQRQAAVAAIHSNWGVIGPARDRLRVWNPGGESTSVDVTFVGSSTVASERLNLRPHATFTGSAHRARAVSLVASAPIVVSAGLTAGEETQSHTLVLASRQRLRVFNPNSAPAHVTISISPSAVASRLTRTVAPLHVGTAVMPVKHPSSVTVSSDVPVAVSHGP